LQHHAAVARKIHLSRLFRFPEPPLIDIGNARTEMVETLIEREQAAGRAAPFTMDVQLVAGAVLHMAELPQEANVLFQTIMATKMPLVGRG